MSVKLQIEPYLECLSLKGGCTGSFESTCVNMPHCWESHVPAELCCGVGSFRVGSHVVSVRIHCTEKWRTSFHTDVLSKSR